MSPDEKLYDTNGRRWTIETLHEHMVSIIEGNEKRYEQRFKAQESAVIAALAAADRAVQKAEMASDKRFEGVNEFRQTLDDQQKTFITRSESEATTRGIAEKITTFQEGSEKDRQSLHKQLDGLLAERMGIKGGWGYAVGLAGLISILVSLAALLARFGKP